MPRFAAAILGESGQAGGAVVKSLLAEPRCSSIVLVNQRQLDGYDSMPRIKQHIVDKAELASEAVSSVLEDNDVKVCFICVKVAKPSMITRGELENLEVHTPTAFAKASKAAGCVRHVSLLSAAAANSKQVENNFEGIGLESVAFFSDRPFSLVIPHDRKTARCASIACRALSSWVFPRREEREREKRVDTLGQAMVMAAVSSLKEAGPPTARYEGESLKALFATSSASSAS